MTNTSLRAVSLHFALALAAVVATGAPTRAATRHVEYCYFNPVKHGLVSQVQNWPHSSFHRDVRRGLFPVDWAGNVDAAGEFGEAARDAGSRAQ